MKDEKKTFSYYVGRALGCIFATCIGVCIAAVVVAMTVKFVGWIF